MMEIMTIGIFCAALLGCILFRQSILVALVFGFVLFSGYGVKKGFSVCEMLHMSWNGIKTVRNILITFILIGMLTALWRAAGTIPVIICYSSWMIRPSVFLLVSFLLNSLVSFLTGTSFGTAATMGVICMTMARTMQINPILAGGSIMSGIFFGDRCSPVSTSALLVSSVTGTDIYDNIRKMFAGALVPYIVTSMIYLFLGFAGMHRDGGMDVWKLFSASFRLSWPALIPAAIILFLSAFRVKVKGTMAVSIFAAVLVCMVIQHRSISEIGKLIVFGYTASEESVGQLLNGGGILSMVRVSAIVCLSSSYSGIFAGTHMLDGICSRIADLRNHMPAFAGMLGISVMTSALSCNQTLSIILTNQLCENLEPDPQIRAIGLEDAPVLVAPLIPWSIAGAVPIAAIGAPTICLLTSCYLYLVPLWHLLRDLRGKGKNGI